MTPGTFVVRVADASGRPFPGAKVFACPEDGEAVERRTGSGGEAEFEPHAGTGFVLVKAPACMPVLQQVAHLAGELHVVLGQGSKVSGIVLVDGDPARAGLRLSLHGKLPATPAPLPAPIVEVFEPWQILSEAITDAQGRFAFAGLAAEWAGSLEMPHTHLLLPRPDNDLDEDTRSDSCSRRRARTWCSRRRNWPWSAAV